MRESSVLVISVYLGVDDGRWRKGGELFNALSASRTRRSRAC